MPSGLFYNFLGRSISYIRGVWLVLLLSCFVEIPELNANDVDPDQMPHSAASDFGLPVCKCPFYGMLGLNGLMVCREHSTNTDFGLFTENIFTWQI